MSTKKELREITDLIVELGGVVLEQRQNKHHCMRVRFGSRVVMITTSVSCSDRRGHLNKIKQIRRMAREATQDAA